MCRIVPSANMLLFGVFKFREGGTEFETVSKRCSKNLNSMSAGILSEKSLPAQPSQPFSGQPIIFSSPSRITQIGGEGSSTFFTPVWEKSFSKGFQSEQFGSMAPVRSPANLASSTVKNWWIEVRWFCGNPAVNGKSIGIVTILKFV